MILKNENQYGERIKEILEKRFNLCLSDLGEEYFDQSLLSSRFSLSARELLYLYFEIEKEFNINIPEDFIVSGKFNNIRSIIQMVELESQQLKR